MVQLFDDFNDNTRDNLRWQYDENHFPVEESGGVMRLFSKKNGVEQNNTVTSVNTGPVYGAKWEMDWSGGASNNMQSYGRLISGSDFIEVFFNSNVPTWMLIGGGIYGNGSSYSYPAPSTSVAVDIFQQGLDIKVRFNAATVFTYSNITIPPNSYFEGSNRVSPPAPGDAPGISGGDKMLAFDNVSFYVPEHSAMVQSMIALGVVLSGLACRRRVRQSSSREVTDGNGKLMTDDESPER